ncbi:MAG: DUF2797 domain-containing protein, partial [Candidatus Tectomicrobia bacterium]
GASQALPILKVQTRRQSGLLEMALKRFVTDKTNWQAMLKGEAPEVDLRAQRASLLAQIHDDIQAVNDQFGADVVAVVDEPVVDIAYPVLNYPTKVRSFNLDKNPQADGILQGIKGQYLIFDTGVINLRKYTGYHLTVRGD